MDSRIDQPIKFDSDGFPIPSVKVQFDSDGFPIPSVKVQFDSDGFPIPQKKSPVQTAGQPSPPPANASSGASSPTASTSTAFDPATFMQQSRQAVLKDNQSQQDNVPVRTSPNLIAKQRTQALQQATVAQQKAAPVINTITHPVATSGQPQQTTTPAAAFNATDFMTNQIKSAYPDIDPNAILSSRSTLEQFTQNKLADINTQLDQLNHQQIEENATPTAANSDIGQSSKLPSVKPLVPEQDTKTATQQKINALQTEKQQYQQAINYFGSIHAGLESGGDPQKAGLLLRQFSGDKQAYQDQELQAKGFTSPQTDYNNAKIGLQALNTTLDAQYANDPTNPQYIQQKQNLQQQNATLLDKYPEVKNKQIASLIGNWFYKDTPQWEIVTGTADKPTSDDIKKLAKEHGLSDSDIKNITSDMIPAPQSFASGVVGGLYNGFLGLGASIARAGGSAVGIDKDWLDYQLNKTQQQAQDRFAQPEGYQLQQGPTIIDQNKNSPTYLQDIPNPNAGKYNYSGATISNSLGQGIGGLAYFIAANKGMTGVIGKMSPELQATAEGQKTLQDLAMMGTMFGGYEGHYQQARQILGDDPDDEAKRHLLALAGVYFDKKVFDFVPTEKLSNALFNDAKSEAIQGIGENIKNLPADLSGMNKSLLVPYLKTAAKAVLDATGETAKINTAATAGVIANHIAGSIVGQNNQASQKAWEDVPEEIKNTWTSSLFNMLVPIGLADLAVAKSPSNLRNEAIYDAAIHPKSYKGNLAKMVNSGAMSTDQAQGKSDIIDAAAQMLKAVPQTNPQTGEALTHEESVKWLNNRLQETALEAKKAGVKDDKVLAKFYDTKIKGLQAEREAMLQPTESQKTENSLPAEPQPALVNHKVNRTEEAPTRNDVLLPNVYNTENRISKKAEIPEDEITIGDMIDKAGSYNGNKGIFYQDGQTVVFKLDGKNKEYEIGNINEIKNSPIDMYNIGHEESVVGLTDRGNILVRGNEYHNNFSDPLSAINTDSEGNIVSVNLETTDGKKRTFRGNIAEDLAYQIHLKELTKNNDTRQKFEDFINSDEPTKNEIHNARLSKTTSENATESNAEISREKIAPKEIKVGTVSDKTEPVNETAVNDIRPHKEVSASKTVAIKEVAQKYNLKGIEASMLHSLKGKDVENEINDAAEGSLKSATLEKLYQKGFITYADEGSNRELSDKGNDFIKAVDARYDTRKNIKAGTDLFPEEANIPELISIKKELKKHIDESTIEQFEHHTSSQAQQLEPAIKDIESKATSDNEAELNEAIKRADNLIESADVQRPAEDKQYAGNSEQSSDQGRPQIGRFELKARELADKLGNAPDWLFGTNDPNFKSAGVNGQLLKKTLQESIIGVGKLLDKGMQLAEAVNRVTDDFVKALEKIYGVKSLDPEYEKRVRAEFQNEATKNFEENTDSDIIGISHEALNDLAEKIGLPAIERGKTYDPKDLADRGRKLLNAGADPNQIAEEFYSSGHTDENGISVIRAKLEDLVKKSNEVEDKNSNAFKENFDELAKLMQVEKDMGNYAHRLFKAFQGKRDLDTDSFSYVYMAAERKLGRKLNKEERSKIDTLTKQVSNLKGKVNEYEERLKNAIDSDLNTKDGQKSQGDTKDTAIVDRAKKLAATIRKGKLNRPGVFNAATPGSIVWDAAVETVAKTIEAGGKLADAISKGIDYIRNSDWYKGLSSDYKKEAEDAFVNAHRNVDSYSLDNLREMLADKKGNKFTSEEAKAIWEYGKNEYLNKGDSYTDMLAAVANDLGFSMKQINSAIITPKTKPLSDEMWKQRSELSRNQANVQRWLSNQGGTTAYKAFKKAINTFREVAVFGHGAIFVGTHAMPTLFDIPRAKYAVKALLNAYKAAYGNRADYELMVADLKNSENYIKAQRAGLQNNPERIGSDSEIISHHLKWISEAGERGFNAIKILRQQLFDTHFNQLPENLKDDPQVLREIAQIVNNATGATNYKVPDWMRETMFAGGMELSRWERIVKNPTKAAGILGKIATGKATPAEKVFLRIWATRAGTIAGVYTGALIVNNAINAYLYQDDDKKRVNFFDPSKGDWFKFKFGTVVLDPTSGMNTSVRFATTLAMMPFEDEKYVRANNQGDNRKNAIARRSIQYGLGKLSPGYGTIAEFVLKHDYVGNTLPFSDDKPFYKRDRKIGWLEYGSQKLPLPIAEGAEIYNEAAHETGVNRSMWDLYLKGIGYGALSGLTGIRAYEDTKAAEPVKNH